MTHYSIFPETETAEFVCFCRTSDMQEPRKMFQREILKFYDWAIAQNFAAKLYYRIVVPSETPSNENIDSLFLQAPFRVRKNKQTGVSK